MKKKIFGGIAVLAVAVVATWNVNLSSNESALSSMALKNVEALAAEEIYIPPKDNTKVQRMAWDDVLQKEICKVPGSSC